MTIRAMFAKGFPYFACVFFEFVRFGFCFCVRGMCFKCSVIHVWLCVCFAVRMNEQTSSFHVCVCIMICIRLHMCNVYVCSRLEFLIVVIFACVYVWCERENNFAESNESVHSDANAHIWNRGFHAITAKEHETTSVQIQIHIRAMIQPISSKQTHTRSLLYTYIHMCIAYIYININICIYICENVVVALHKPE